MMIALILLAASTAPAVQWKPLQPGVELAVIAAATPRALYVVRVDPARAPLDVALASETGTGCSPSPSERLRGARRDASIKERRPVFRSFLVRAVGVRP